MIQYASVHLLQQAAAFMAGGAVLLLSYTSMLLCLWGPTLTFGDKMPKQILCVGNCVYDAVHQQQCSKEKCGGVTWSPCEAVFICLCSRALTVMEMWMLCFLSVFLLSITVLCLRNKSYISVDSSCPFSVLPALCETQLLFLLFIFNAIFFYILG